MQTSSVELASTASSLVTCSRCGDNLSSDQAAANGLCAACKRLLGERALERLLLVRPVLAGLLLATVVGAALAIVSKLLQLALLQHMEAGDMTQAEARLNDLRDNIIIVAQLALSLATAITWVIWFRRSHHFVKIAGRPMDYGPNAWGWFLVPIANLYKPYEALKELWLTATRREQGDRPFILPLWWCAWLLSKTLASPMLWTFFEPADRISKLTRMTYLELADNGMLAPSAVAALMAVRAIDRALKIDALV